MIDNNIIKLFDLTNIEKVDDNSYIGYSNMTNNGMAGITMDGVNVQQKIKLYLLQNQNVGK